MGSISRIFEEAAITEPKQLALNRSYIKLRINTQTTTISITPGWPLSVAWDKKKPVVSIIVAIVAESAQG